MKLRIGPHDVEVVSTPAVSLDLARASAYGDSDVGKLVIRIQHDLPASVWRETLVHEVLHHVWALTPLPALLGDDDEERVVRALAPYLAALGFLSDRTRRWAANAGADDGPE
jgi:hypothetical protein